MKSTFKFISLFIVAAGILFANAANAQTTPAKGLALSMGVGIGDPTGNAHNYSTFTLGGTARLQYGLTDRFALTFTTGGDHFFSKKIPGTDKRYTSYGLIPLKAGVKAFFTPNLYIGAEAGAGFEVLEHTFFKGGQTKLLLSPAVGYANKHWDLGVCYDSATGNQNNYGILALRVAYGIPL